MTGFGVGRAELPGGGRVLVEARSLNHRYLELRVLAPPELSAHTFFLEQHARRRTRRGRYSLQLRFEGTPPAPVELDGARATAAYRALAALRDQLEPGAPLPLSLLAAVPDLFRAPRELDPEAVRSALAQALDAALTELDAMRTSEGAALAADLTGHLAEARRLHAELGARVPLQQEAVRERLRARAERMVRDQGLEPDAPRLETELALAVDRSDASEELARLGSHFDQFERLVRDAAAEAVGRRLDFLLQEMTREANTLAAKSQDAAVSHAAVELKAVIERLREQVQNVE